MKTCRICGAQSIETLSSCARCRAPLDRTTTTRRTPLSTAQDPAGSSGLVPEPWLLQASSIGKRQPRNEAQREFHYLVPPFGDPIRLEPRPGATLVLGRDEDCEVRIASAAVSRKHAEIAFRGRPARGYLRDLGGMNGTRLNGAIVAGERTLADRDVLRLGEITALYRVIRQGTSAAAAIEGPSAPERLSTTMALGVDADTDGATLVADIQLVSVEDIIGRLILLKATGVLIVEVDGTPGHARFEDGRVRDARFSDRAGDGAVRTMAGLTRGRCRVNLVPRAAPEAPQVDVRTITADR